MPKSPLEIIRKAEELQNPDVLAEVVLDIEEDVEEMEVKIEQIKEIAETTKKEKGEKGDKHTDEEVIELIKPLIPEPIKGDNYILTDKDKKDIASSIKVPIVNKIIEKTEVIKEIPIITNEVKEVAKTDTGEQIVDKINLQPKKIESSKLDLSKVEKDIKELKEKPAIINNIMGGQGGASGIRDIRAGTNISITKVNDVYTVNSTASSENPSLQQVTDVGASTTVESTFSGGTISNKVKANSSAGFLIEASNGTDVGLLGVGNTANVSWYGSHNYTGRLYAQRDAGGATPVEGMVVDNTTNATASVLQASPSFLRRGRGFLSNSSTSYPFEVQDYTIGEVNIVAYGKWIQQFKANNGSWQEFMRFDSAPLGQGFAITPGQALSNGTPGTTRNFTINNTGSHSWIDFVFSGVRKSHIGAGNSGEMKFYAGGGSYFEYYQMSGGLFSYNYPTAFVHSSHGIFGGKVHAGSQTTPTSTLQNAGGTALKVAYSAVNLTLDDTATQWILEPSTASCVGTPTYACNHWTNETDCLLRDAHGGCSWFAGNPCSAFDNEFGMGTCAGTSGCTVATASCSGAGDESACTSQDDAYGGSCAWNGNDCGALGEGSCAGTSGCSANYSDCSTFPDEGSCTAVSGCSWDGMSCSGTYFSGCSGTYYTCDGTYNTGSCTGTYGASCTGTSACAGIDDSTSCGGEGGCSWSTSITALLPNGDNFPSRTLWVYKKGATGTVVLTPNAGQTVNFAPTYTMSSDKEWVHLAYYNLTADCSVYNANESTCGSTSGCTQNYSFCSWNSGDGTCSGNAVCTGIGDESSCTSTSWFSSCSGTYSISKNWYKFGS